MNHTNKLEVLTKDAGLLPSVPEVSGMDIATSRQAQEVMAAMAIAKRFPRNETLSISRIMQACDRLTLAENALYAYPRGGTTVTGPSIRLAEALARGWGNIDSGVIELEQKNGESVVMSYAWDLETNARSTKVFTVKHERKAGKEIKRLDDPRDIYEMVANQGARRLRACILSIIPGDVTDMAVEQCEKTIKSGDKTPLKERTAKVLAFLTGMGVTTEMVEKRIGHKIEAMSETELVNLRKICKSLDDGAAKVEDFFDKGAVTSSKSEAPATTIPTKTTAPTPADDAPPMDGATPLAQAESPAPAQAPSQSAAAEMEEANALLTEIAEKAKASGVTQVQILAFCKKQKLAGRMVDSVEMMANSKLKLLLSEWDNVIEKIKAEK